MAAGIIIVPFSMPDPVLIYVIMSVFVFIRYGISDPVPRAVIMGLPVAVYYSISGYIMMLIIMLYNMGAALLKRL
ncbi:MAG: hypothetical protein U9R02_08740 [Thermodesulfobacteriota bacterium]|nr:hypothetical protein [Thermodesulfobacteriota bacterium]